MTTIDFIIASFFLGPIILYIPFRFYFLPWWIPFYEKRTASYKLAMRFIWENQKLEDKLGQIVEVNSVPFDPSATSYVAMYKFEVIGKTGRGILTIKMASKLEWYIYRAVLDYHGTDIVIYATKS